jgi:hypothetical protein
MDPNGVERAAAPAALVGTQPSTHAAVLLGGWWWRAGQATTALIGRRRLRGDRVVGRAIAARRATRPAAPSRASDRVRPGGALAVVFYVRPRASEPHLLLSARARRPRGGGDRPPSCTVSSPSAVGTAASAPDAVGILVVGAVQEFVKLRGPARLRHPRATSRSTGRTPPRRAGYAAVEDATAVDNGADSASRRGGRRSRARAGHLGGRHRLLGRAKFRRTGVAWMPVGLLLACV